MSSSASRGVIRAIIGIALLGIILVFMGISDLIADSNGSHRDISEMNIESFVKGDVVKANITETWGCSMTETETSTVFGFIPTGSRTSAYYYIIPYYESFDDPLPVKIVLFRTGNSTHHDTLERLAEETERWYNSESTGTFSHLNIDRAIVTNMTSEEKNYLYEDYRNIADSYGAAYSNTVYDTLVAATVPYVIRYNADNGSILTFIGIILLGVDALIFIILLAKSRNEESVPQVTYVGSSANAGNYGPSIDDPMFAPPPRNKTTVTNYDRPLPPLSGTGENAGASTGVTTIPSVDSISMPSVGGIKPNTGDSVPTVGNPLDDPNFGRPNAGGRSFGRRPEPNRVRGESMDFVDPHTEENIDTTNGGIAPDDRSSATRTSSSLLHDSGLPVLNPTEQNTGGLHEDIEVTPLSGRPDYTSGSLVEPTEPSMRNTYKVGGQMMQEVDPYTEKNVDISNGGIEKPDIPDITAFTTIPETASVPETPAAPQTSSIPDTSDLFKDIVLPDFPKAEDIPKMPEPPKFP